MLGLPILDLIVLAGYFLMLIIIGYWASRRIKNQEDFFLAGRGFGKFVQTFASFGQATSAENAVGMTVFVARNGIAGIWQNLILVFNLPFYWISSVWYRRMRLISMGDFFEERYNSKNIAAFYAVVSTVFFMIVIGLGFTAMTKTISAIVPKPYTELTIIEKNEVDRAHYLDKLEDINYNLLSENEKTELKALRLEKPNREFSYINEKLLIWIVALIVIIYAGAGGLMAAFLIDTIQGIFILVLSFILLPFSFSRINNMFGGQGIDGIVQAAKSQLPEASFEVWGSPAVVDFTWYYILALLVVLTINYSVQANQLTATGSAKDERTAQIGFTSGIFMKRFSTLVWGISALLLVVLYAGKVNNPDYIWGVACRELLGGFGFGLLGLMIASLLAAMLSTADALALTASGLLTRNCIRPLFPNLDERNYVHIGRLSIVFIIVGAVLIASQFDNIFQLLKIIWEFNIVLAAAFFLGLKWRRANRKGAKYSMYGAMIFFIILQVLIPMIGGVRANEFLALTTKSETVLRTYTATKADVNERNDLIAEWNSLQMAGKAEFDKPEPLTAGLEFEKEYVLPQKSVFWTKGLKVNEKGVVYGSGMLSLELVLLRMVGIKLENNAYALNETIRLLIRSLLPFIILIFVALFTQPDDKKRLDRFYARMKTPVMADKEADMNEVKLSYENPQRFDYKKMFPKSAWEFEKFEKSDIRGILALFAGGVIIFSLLFGFASLFK